MSFTCSNCGFGWNEETPTCPRCDTVQTLAKRKLRGFEFAVCLFVAGAVGATGGALLIDGIVIAPQIPLLARLYMSVMNITLLFGLLLLGLTLFVCWRLVCDA